MKRQTAHITEGPDNVVLLLAALPEVRPGPLFCPAVKALPLAVEPLEDRLAPASLTLTGTPTDSFTNGYDQHNEDASSRSVSVYVGGVVLSADFSISGGVHVSIQADPGEAIGAPVLITVSSSVVLQNYGLNGAESFPNVHAQASISSSYGPISGTLAGATLPSGQGDHGEGNITVPGRIGDSFDISFSGSGGLGDNTDPYQRGRYNFLSASLSASVGVSDVPAELVAKSLVPHPSSSGFDGFDLKYAITGADLPNSTDIHFFWSNTNTWSRSSLTDPQLNFVDAHSPITTGVTKNDTNNPVYTVYLPGNDFVAPPPQDTYLIAVLNYSHLLPVASYPEDATSATFSSAPTAQFVVKAAPPDSGPQKKIPYSVSVVITNPGPVPVAFPMKWEEVFLLPADLQDYPSGALLGRSGNIVVKPDKPIKVGDTLTTPLGTFTRTWNWIGADYPFTSPDKVTELFTEANIKEIYKALEKEAFGTSILKRFFDVKKAVDAFNDLVTNPIRHADISYRINSTINPIGQTLLSDSTDVQLSVPGERQAALVAFEAAYIAGKEFLKASIKASILAALVDPTKISLAVSVASAVASALVLAQSTNLYAAAVDPPDLHYRELATPQPVKIAEVESLPAGPYKDLAQMALDLLALTKAEATSRNRADGAQAAGDLLWESQQLIAASGFASQAAALQERFDALYASLESDLRARLTPFDGQVYSYLQTNGLPPLFARVLGQFGWSATDIENLRQNMVALGPSLVTEEEPVDEVLRLLPFASTEAASDQLTLAVQIQTGDLAKAVGHITPSERAALDRKEASILTQFSAPSQSWSLYNEITAYVAEVRQVLLQTHNMDELRDYMDFGSGALVNFATIAPSAVAISATSLTPAKVGVGFAQTLIASGGAGPLHFGIASGHLPLGIALNADTGVIGGIPRVPGTFSFVVGVTDSSTGTGPYGATQQLTLVVRQGDAAILKFLTQPGAAPPNGFLAPFQVLVLDQFGNRVSGVVRLALVPIVAQGQPGFTPGSVVQGVAVNGVATFGRVAISTRGRYKLLAEIGALTVLSDPFNVGLVGRQWN